MRASFDAFPRDASPGFSVGQKEEAARRLFVFFKSVFANWRSSMRPSKLSIPAHRILRVG